MTQENGPLHVGDGDFEAKIVNASTPAVVDFWAPWCGPCRIIAPVVEELAQEYAGRIVVAKVNTDKHKRWASQLGIRGIPTMVFFKNGEEVDRVVGAVPRDLLVQRLDSLL